MIEIPDIFTHLLVGLSIGHIFSNRWKDSRVVMVVIGSVIIDIERPIGWIVSYLRFDLPPITHGFHSLLGVLILSFVSASMFVDIEMNRFDRYKYLFIGGASHIMMDMTLHPWPEQGVHLLYPFKMPFSFNLFYADFVLFPLIGLGFLLVSVIIRLLHTELYS